MGKDFERLVGQVVASGALSKAERARRKEEAAKARRSEKRAERDRLRIAAAAEIWEDREGKARPTPERIRKGVFRLREGDLAGVSIAVAEVESIVDALAAKGLLTPRQREAGHGVEDVARGVLGSPSGRSCCDMTPVGYDGDEDDEGAAHAAARWNSLRRMLHPADRRECIAVCWERRRPSSLDRLRRGLDAAGDWLGLAKDRD